MVKDRIWCPWPDRLFALDTGSMQYAYVFGLAVGKVGRSAFLTALGQSVTVFDGFAEYLPFDPDTPDAPGFWIGRRWYVAFNRGKDD